MQSPFLFGATNLQQSVFEPKYNSIEVAQTHSQLTAVLAGFAFAALILLIERYQNASDDQSNKFAKAMYLFFIAFVTGSVSSFLYSSQVGDEYPRAYLSFIFASSAFELHVFLLTLSIVFVFDAFQKPLLEEGKNLDLSFMIRMVYMLIVLMTLLRVWSDNSHAMYLASQTNVPISLTVQSDNLHTMYSALQTNTEGYWQWLTAFVIVIPIMLSRAIASKMKESR